MMMHAGIYLEDAEDEDEADVIKVYYYGDEEDIDPNDVLEVVKRFDGSAEIK